MGRSWRRAWRQRPLRLVFAAAVLAAAGAGAAAWLADRLEQAVLRRGAELLGADLVIEGGRPPPEAWAARAAAAGLATTQLVRFPTVVAAGERFELVQVQAVEAGYPLRGEVRIAAAPGAPAVAAGGVPEPGTVWIEPRLADALGLVPGATLELGAARLRVAALLHHRPDQDFGFSQLAPTVLMHRADLAATGLLGPASRVRHRLLVAGPPAALARYAAALEREPDDDWRLLRVGEGRSGGARLVDRLAVFLDLAVLAAWLAAAAAVLLASRLYLAAEADVVALLKTLGASRRRALAHALGEWLAVLLPGLVLGAALAWAVQAGVAVLLGALALPSPRFGPGLAAAAVSGVWLAGAALPALLRLAAAPPVRVLGGAAADAAARAPLWTLPPAIAAVVAVAGWMGGRSGAGLAALGLLTALAALALVAAALGGAATALRRRLPPGPLRLAVAALAHNRRVNGLFVVALGCALLALFTLGGLREALLGAWQRHLEGGAPTHFLINVQTPQKAAVAETLAAAGVEARFFPMVRARLVAVEGQPAAAYRPADPERGRWFLERDQNLSWSETLPEANTLLAGRWIGRAGPGEAVPLSLDADIARDLGVGLGSELVFEVEGERLVTRVASLRAVDWASLRPNFFVLLPAGVLPERAAAWVTSVHLPAERANVLQALRRAHPTVTVIDLRALLAQLQALFAQAAAALQWIFAFVLAAAVLVLLAVVQWTAAERARQAALWRALGAARRTVLAATTLEFAALGALAAAAAAVLGHAAGAALTVWVFELPWRAPWFDTAVLLLAAAGGVAALGRWALLRPLATPPWRLLGGA